MSRYLLKWKQRCRWYSVLILIHRIQLCAESFILMNTSTKNAYKKLHNIYHDKYDLLMRNVFQILHKSFQSNYDMGRSKSAILAIFSIYTISELDAIELNHYHYHFSRYSYAGQLQRSIEFIYVCAENHKNWCVSESNVKCLKRWYVLS